MKNYEISKYLKQQRRLFGLETYEMAKRIGIEKKTLEQFESGEYDKLLSLFVNICESSGLPISLFHFCKDF